MSQIANASRKKASKISPAEWAFHKAEIISLYMNKGKTQPQILDILRNKFFEVSPRQLKLKLSQWGCIRNIWLQDEQCRFIFAILQHRDQPTAIRINGRRLNQKEVEKVKRSISRRIKKEMITPSMAIECSGISIFTPSESGLSSTREISSASVLELSSQSGQERHYETMDQTVPATFQSSPPVALPYDVDHDPPQFDDEEMDEIMDWAFDNPELAKEIGADFTNGMAQEQFGPDEGGNFPSLVESMVGEGEERSSMREGGDELTWLGLPSTELSDLDMEMFGMLDVLAPPPVTSEMGVMDISQSQSNLTPSPNSNPAPQSLPSVVGPPTLINEKDPSTFQDAVASSSRARPEELHWDDSFGDRRSCASPFGSEIVQGLSSFRSLSPPENSNFYSGLPPTSAQAGTVTTEDTTIDDDLETDLQHMRQQIKSGRRGDLDAGWKILTDVLIRIIERDRQKETNVLEAIWNGERGIEAKIVVARYEAATMQQRQELGPRHPLLQELMNRFTGFLHTIVKAERDTVDYNPEKTGKWLDKAATNLTTTLETFFDDEVVRIIGPRVINDDEDIFRTDDEDGERELDTYATSLIECVKIPFLAETIAQSLEYNELNSKYHFSMVMEDMYQEGKLVKQVIDGQVMFTPTASFQKDTERKFRNL